MFLRNIKVSNFKSFEEISVDLDRFNVVVGANASGKSNFIGVFSFLKDIMDSGLDNAISIQGADYIRNISLDSSQDLSIELHVDSEDELAFVEEEDQEFIGISPQEFFYRLSINFHSRKGGHRIVEEMLGIGVEITRTEERNGARRETEPPRKGRIIFTNNGRKIKHEIDESIRKDLERYVFPLSIVNKFREENWRGKLLLESEIPLFIVPWDSLLKDFIQNISIYDFPRRLLKSLGELSWNLTAVT